LETKEKKMSSDPKVAVGTVVPEVRKPLEKKAVLDLLAKCKGATVPGKSEDGTRLHVEYHRIPGRKVTDRAKQEAERAKVLELPMDRFTGKLDRVWVSKAGETQVTVLVELERDKKYRTFNVDQGEIHKFVILGD
jgi:hypothetical protein